MAKLEARGNLKIEYRPVGKLKPWANNARAHPPEQIEALVDSLKRRGFYAPLLVDSKKGRILKGNGTFQAALQLDMRTVPVIEIGGLTEAELRALVIADNRLAERSGWDKSLLALELTELQGMGFDLKATGFLTAEIEELLRPSPGPSTAEPATPALPAKAVSKLGDVWVMGQNRLICGDATKAATLKTLMAGRQAQCVFTDPPYGISYEAPSGSFEVIQGDDLRRGQLSNLLHGAFSAAIEHTREDAAWYVWHASATREEFSTALRDVGLVELSQIIWAKPGMVLGWSNYRWSHEPCIYAARQGVRPAHYGPRTETTVIRMNALGPKGEPHAAIGQGIIITTPDGTELYVSATPPKGRKVRHVHLEAGKPILLSTSGGQADDVWEVSRDNGHGKETKTFHPTQKPVELARRAITNSTKEGEIVLDSFNGSGSTIMAAEQTGRAGYAAELDPRYVDQSVIRWQGMTGKQAIHASEKKTYDAIAKARAGRKG
jgi:DNA modification methylase